MNVTMPWSPSADTPANGVSAKLDLLKKSLSEQADNITDSKIAEEAASQAKKIAGETSDVAATVARDSVSSVGGLLQSFVDAIASFVASLTESGRKTATDLGHDAQAAASELRKVRITTEPKKTGPDFMPGITLLGGFAAGVGLMYFFDPEQGKRRRAQLRDQLTKLTRVTGETVQGRTKDLGNRAQGAAIEARKSLQGVMASGQQNAEADTQPWSPMGESQPAAIASTDASITDTWGERPSTNDSQPGDVERIQIS